MTSAVLLCLLLSGLCLQAQVAPRIFFTDLESGPSSGGENDQGAFVTIYGKGFGVTQGESFVTIGDGPAAVYRLWSDSRITVQLGPSVSTGPVQVNTSYGQSNTVGFTVRPGRLFFVSPDGADTNDGSFDSPFATFVKCKNAIAAGDTCYVMDGVVATKMDAYNALLSIVKGGSAEMPMAIVAYPNAHPQIGDPSGVSSYIGIRIPNTNVNVNYWVIAGLDIVGASEAITLGGVNGSLGWRIIGNRLSCPSGDGGSACFSTGRAIGVRFWGNEVFRAGCSETDVPCATAKASALITTSDTTLSTETSLYPLIPGSRIFVNGQSRIITTVNGKSGTLDSAFQPDISTPTNFTYRFPRPSKLYHSVYFGTDSSSIDAGWNYLHDNRGCRGIQFHSTPTLGMVAPAAPVLEAVPGGDLPARTYTVRVTYMVRSDQYNAIGHRETAPSAASTISLDAGTLLKVHAPAENPVATGWGIYAAIADDAAKRQNDPAAPTSPAEDWTEPESGLIQGQALPVGNNAYKNGFNQWDLNVHDNLIQDTVCDAINFATVDPSKGAVRAYNNIIVRGGIGPDPPPDPAGYACIYVPGTTNNGASGKGTVEIYNNTLYNCGARGGASAGAVIRGRNSPELNVELKNNVVLLTGDESYLAGSPSNLITGGNNVWFGASQALDSYTQLQNDLLQDPQFVDPQALDFHPGLGSPVLSAGSSPLVDWDFDGSGRPGAGSTAGALEPAPLSLLDATDGSITAIAPGAQVNLVGQSIGTATSLVNSLTDGLIPSFIEDLTVLFDGTPAPILRGDTTRLRLIVPYDVDGKTQVTVHVLRFGLEIAAITVPVVPYAPSIFLKEGSRNAAAVLNEDLSVNSPSNAAAPGSLITFQVNGLGLINPSSQAGVSVISPLPVPGNPVSVLMGNRPAPDLQSVELVPDGSGAVQVKVRIPSDMEPGWTPLRVTVADRTSKDGVYFYVQRPPMD